MPIVTGQFINTFNHTIFPARVLFNQGKIISVENISSVPANSGFSIPGFTDAHVHIESSMLTPASFARLAVVHGTVSTISDPHEIANVCGIPGIDFMIRNGQTVPFKFYFGAPSCGARVEIRREV